MGMEHLPTSMSHEFSKWLASVGYNPNDSIYPIYK